MVKMMNDREVFNKEDENSLPNDAQEPDVRTVLKEMCGCMRQYKNEKPRSRLYQMISSWYMPRNEHDAMSYMRRYRVWSILLPMVHECIKGKEENNG